MDRKRYRVLRGLMSLLLPLALSGCASGTPVAANAGHPDERAIAMRPVRVIITFQRSTTDSPRLSAAIAEACHCSPVFVRPFLSRALIYQISLLQDRPFGVFEKALLSRGAPFGVVGVERDSLEHY